MLNIAVQAAAVAGPQTSTSRSWLWHISSGRWNAFRHAFHGDPSASVEPLFVTLKRGARAVKAHGRKHSPAKASWLAACVASLVALGLVFLNPQAVWASPAMAVTKKGNQRFASDYRAANSQFEKVPEVMPDQEVESDRLRGTCVFGKPDMLQGYWRCPLSVEAQQIFTIAIPMDLYTPLRVLQGGCQRHGLSLSASHTTIARSGL